MATVLRPRRPVCPAIRVCDRVVARTDVGKFDVVGMFDAPVVPAVPVRLSLTVSFALADGEGEYELRPTLEQDQTEATLGSATRCTRPRAPDFDSPQLPIYVQRGKEIRLVQF